MCMDFVLEVCMYRRSLSKRPAGEYVSALIFSKTGSMSVGKRTSSNEEFIWRRSFCRHNFRCH